MLIIQNDPAGVTGRTRYPLDCSISLQANIEQHLASGHGCTLTINGVEIDPLTDARMDEPPKLFDSVVVTRRPEGVDPVTIAIAVAVATLAATALMPKPDFGATATRNESPNNKLTQQTNIARAYQGIPDVYGRRRVWPDLIQSSTVEYINHIKYVTEWLCVSRGIGTISDVKYADTPITDIDGASFEVFGPNPIGTEFQEWRTTTINGILETFASDEVNGQELTPVEPFAEFTRFGAYSATIGATQFTATMPDGAELDQLKSLSPSGTALVSFERAGGAGTFTETCTVLSWSIVGTDAVFVLSSSAWAATESGSTMFDITPNGSTGTVLGPFTLSIDCDRLRWNTVFLRGLKGTVNIAATWWQVDALGAEISGTRQTQADTYTADTYDQRYYTTNVTPTAGHGRYRIQFERTNAVNGDGSADVAKLEEVYAVRYYASKVLPGVTVIRVTTKATEEATGFSDRKFNLVWQRSVSTLTGMLAAGVSRNFGRIMSHIWKVAGGDVVELDTDTLAAINAEFGEDSPLLRFDGSLDDADMSLGERLQAVANAARCQLWRDGTRWTVTRDQARDYPEMQLDYRNLAAGGDSAIAYSAHLPASYDGVEVEYVDEATQAKKAYIRLNISTGAPVAGAVANPLKIKLTGCATTAQAENRAQLEARKLIYRRVSVQDTALSDAGSLGIGALVRWVDPNDFAGDDGLQAGEVLSIAGDLITTSEPLQWGSETAGRILFTGTDGALLGSPVVCYPAAGGAVQLASVPAGLFVADGVTRQLGSRYAFSVGLTDAEMEAAGLYTVAEIRPAGDGTYSLSLAQYDSRIYDAD
jgi:hypothetical protein